MDSAPGSSLQNDPGGTVPTHTPLPAPSPATERHRRPDPTRPDPTRTDPTRTDPDRTDPDKQPCRHASSDRDDPAPASQRHAIDAVERTVAELGRLDTVVNNAGVMLLGPIVDAPTAEWDRMVALNLQGLLYVAHAALPHLLTAADAGPRNVAGLVNISSVAGRRAATNSGVYNLTKFGVNAFTESLRQEVAERHVRVSVVEPGAVATELTDHLRPAIREPALKVFAGVETLQAEDIADAIAYIVTRPRRVAVNEILIRPTEQVR
ncbi:SDR family NAD(P)-dependent oxidoreductase [Candidatus Frankia alpina]|uniref:SDR family NAD(P)-dependent oxidoreductase n=1 Tax=Candidatus Frankia alpina TaxID=2699483 RepID=UPI001F2A5848|nr:SDR family NAD(P)-dependent oxidoreductase [Candidatus Frankia alpina]